MTALPALLDEQVRALAVTILKRREFPFWHDTPGLISFLAWLSGLWETDPVLYWAMLAGLVAVALLLLAHVTWAVRRALAVPAPARPPRPDTAAPPFLEEADALARRGMFLEAARRVQLAALDLLTGLGFRVVRTHEPPEDLAPDATVWWIEPAELCRSVPGGGWRGEPWVRAGGTAVLFLAPAVGEDAGCALLEGVVLPRRVADTSGGASPRGARGERPATAHGVSGDALPRARTVEVPGLLTFADAGDWRVRAVSAERPLVLERALGAGRIVAVADATVLRNQSLDRGDAALLVVDLVRAFGVPRFHEGGEGPRARRSAAAYLATSPALLVFCGLALTGVLFAWQGNLVPPRALPGPGTDTPGLDAFVDSLAALYAGTRDHARVLERYRELAAARLRRHFGMPPETPVGVLAERLACDRRLGPSALRLLVEGAPVAGERSLRDAVRVLDALVQEASA